MHDDTAKRRSEEILRAVAAAATADYEGLRQMQHQKVETKGKIGATIRTKQCLSDLSEALLKEADQLDGKAAAANTSVHGTHAAEITDKKEALQQAIQDAIGTIYNETKNRYDKLMKHAKEMMAALEKEVNERVKHVEEGNNSPEKIAADVIAKVIENGNGEITEAMLEKELEQLFLTQAHEEALKKYDDGENGLDETGLEADQGMVNLESLLQLAGMNGASNPGHYSEDFFNRRHVEIDRYKTNHAGANPADMVPGTGAQEHPVFHQSGNEVMGFNYGHPITPNTNANPGLTHGTHTKMTRLEHAHHEKIKAEALKYFTAHKNNAAATTKQQAYGAAKNSAHSRFVVVNNSYNSLTIYLDKLKELDKDELKKIADIGEEFESLAADWLQLAIYHCCDIVQGNQLECNDATKHLTAPLETVITGALKIPNVRTDCGRRLL